MRPNHHPLYLGNIRGHFETLPLSELDGKTVFITGATGMICSCITDLLLCWNASGGNIRIVASSRNKEKLQKRFGEENPLFQMVEWDAGDPVDADIQADYIIHGASNADPANFAKKPVDTLLANVVGTHELLKYGCRRGMKRFLYLSSGEMYGQPDDSMADFTESYCGPVDHSSPRSCYPAGKRAAESLCQSYVSQYDADAVIARPCHIFGPTMLWQDSRAVSEFFRSAVLGKDIVLKSAGLMERSHCYVADAAAAILFILLRGNKGEAYNVADPHYQMTIRRFAEEVAKAGNTKVIYENPSDLELAGYSKVKRAVLGTDKLRALGWTPHSEERSKIEMTVQILRSAQKR